MLEAGFSPTLIKLVITTMSSMINEEEKTRSHSSTPPGAEDKQRDCLRINLPKCALHKHRGKAEHIAKCDGTSLSQTLN